jgi:hypothetical protein
MCTVRILNFLYIYIFDSVFCRFCQTLYTSLPWPTDIHTQELISQKTVCAFLQVDFLSFEKNRQEKIDAKERN